MGTQTSDARLVECRFSLLYLLWSDASCASSNLSIEITRTTFSSCRTARVAAKHYEYRSSSSFQRHVEAELQSVGGVGVARNVALAFGGAEPADEEAEAEEEAAEAAASKSYTTRGDSRMSTRRLNSSSVRRLPKYGLFTFTGHLYRSYCRVSRVLIFD